MQQFRNTLPIPYILMFIGGSCFLYGAYMMYQYSVFIGLNGHATGTVVAIHPGMASSRSNGRSAVPEVTFTASNGKTVTFTNPVGSMRFRKDVGATVPVYYSTRNPQNARTPLESDGKFWFILYGAMFFWFGVKVKQRGEWL